MYICIFIAGIFESYFIYSFYKSNDIKNQFQDVVKFLNVTAISAPFYYEVDNLLR